MLIKPKVRGFICASAHPVGCEQMVGSMIQTTQVGGHFQGPKRVLVIGASTGYGLASRVGAAFGSGAKTIGVFYERAPTPKRTASAGWYNSAAFERFAHNEHLYAKSINGDAFSDTIKQQTIDLIKEDWGGEVDLIVYSLASPRRTDPKTGQVYQSCLKTVGQSYQAHSVDPIRGTYQLVSIDPATDDDIAQTIAIMGGQDWALWIDALANAGVLAQDFKTVAYSYIGPELTFPIYRDGTIGQAKNDLLATAGVIANAHAHLGAKAWVSVNKAVVTQASAAIPVVPLYLSVLFQIMQPMGLHEDCMAQILRLYKDRLYVAGDTLVDELGRIRLDDWEMDSQVQDAVSACWSNISADNLQDLVDLSLFRRSFYQLFGFEVDGIDYDADVDPMVMIPSIEERTEK